MSHWSRLILALGLLCGAATPLSAGTVDSRQFGLIQQGMTEAGVREQLGAPDTVAASATTFTRLPGTRDYREVKRYVWIYQGTSQVMTTYIFFQDGRVVGKNKVRD